MERYQGGLEREPANEQAKGQQQRCVHAGLGDAPGHVRHIQRTGDAVNQCDGNQDQGGG